MNTRKQASAERREERARARQKLTELRRQLRDARSRRKSAMFDAKERCRADRLATRERLRALRIRVLEDLRATTRNERAAARYACHARLRDARAIQHEVGRTRAEVAAERLLQRELRAAAMADKERRRRAPPQTCHECRTETDDDVRASIPSDLAALYDRVKRTLKPAPGSSRAEAFLKWAEGHPAEVLEATAHPAHVAVRELEAQTAAAECRLNPYEARKAERLNRLREKAQRLELAAEGAHAAARGIAEHIPMGQPILVGHHSERRHRRDLDRIDRGYRKSAELAREADALRLRAQRSEATDAISSDDPDAIPKLRAKLEGLESNRARMVATNKAVRSKDPRSALATMAYSAAAIDKLLAPDFAGRVGFPAYALANAASEVARVRKRIAGLEARAVSAAPAAVHVGDVRIEEADNRVRIVFPGKPDEATRAALKKSGFRWSPTVGAWQRHASHGAWFEAKRVFGAGMQLMRGIVAERAANQNALTAGGPSPDETARLRALSERGRPSVKGEGLNTTQIAAAIRAEIAAAVQAGLIPKATYSVKTAKYSMGSSITVVATNLPFPVLNPEAFVVEPGARWMRFDREHYRTRFTPRAEAVERSLNAIVDAYHWDRSDLMTDYHNERFAKHVEVKEHEGAWKKLELAKLAHAAEERV